MTPTPTTVWGLSPAELAESVVFSGEPPAWLSEPGSIAPAVDVLAVAMGSFVLCGPQQPYELMFLNAESGDRFDMTVPAGSGMLWLDSHTFGLFWKTADILLSIDFADRSVEATSLGAEGLSHLWIAGDRYDETISGCMMNAVYVPPGLAPGEDEIGPISPWGVSADRTMFVTRNVTNTILEVRRVGTNALVWSPDSVPEDDETHEADAVWSPVEPARLAVVEGEADTTGSFAGRRLYVVDVVQGEEVASFPGEFMGISWSPDGSRILYQSPEWDLRSANMGFSGPPCVLDIRTGEQECLAQIPASHFPGDLGIEVRRLDHLRWDRSGTGFFYMYSATYRLRNGLGTPETAYESLAGLCHFEFASGEESCPSDGVPDLHATFWFDYDLSPDERFAYVQASAGQSGAHGVLNMQDRQFFRLPDPRPGGGCEGFYCFVTALWRPPLEEPAEATPTPTVAPRWLRPSRPSEREVREIRSIWAVNDLEQPTLLEPGTHHFWVQISPDEPLIWPFYWCALGEERLAENLESISVDFFLEGSHVARDDILEFDTTSGAWACHNWATYLSGWQSGSQSSMRLRFRLSMPVSDGADTYEAGDYIFEVLAAVGDQTRRPTTLIVTVTDAKTQLP